MANYSKHLFTYRVFDVDGGMCIELVQLETGAVMPFFLAGHTVETNGERISSHMNSLTDDLMMSWFEKRGKKPKKEKKG